MRLLKPIMTMKSFEKEWVMSNELVADMLEALEQMVDGIRGKLPPNSVGEGDWLDTMPHMDEPVALAEEAMEKARAFLEGGK